MTSELSSQHSVVVSHLCSNMICVHYAFKLLGLKCTVSLIHCVQEKKSAQCFYYNSANSANSYKICTQCLQ